MQKYWFLFGLIIILLSAFFGLNVFTASDPLELDVDIPYTKHKLDNGLTLIIHEDHKAPLVAVNIWYHVGSKNEIRGRTGFAHLFEHLMFNGSENYNHDYFKALEKLGATNLNGTTNWDRTNYFQNVPASALDTVLWLESDRMGNLLGAITQEKLDEQREVVQNEKRQGENSPYGKGAEIQYKSIYPYHHPYSWTTIGSMKDLNAATLEDVHAWFNQYYGASNTVLVIAGAVNKEEVIKKVEHYFGGIQPGPPLTKHSSWPVKLTGTHKEISYDRVPQTMMMKSWNIEGGKSFDTNMLDMIAGILSGGKNSRLYKRLVYDEKLVSSISAYTSAGEIAGTFEITAMINTDKSESLVDQIIEEEVDQFLHTGPTERELEKIKIQTVSGFVRGMERIGGFGGKSDLLADNYVYTGDPHYYKKELGWIRSASVEDLKRVANKWLSDGLYQLEIRPLEKFNAIASQVDRSAFPLLAKSPEVAFEKFERARLENGLDIIVANRSTVPIIQIQLLIDAGYAADQFSIPGVASMAMNMLDEGSRNLNALEINEALIMAGAHLSTGSNLDTSSVSLSSLSSTLDDSLKIFADVVLNPSFPEEELERIRQLQETRIRREQSNPSSMAMRVFPKLIYGPGHAYSNPLTGSGTLDSISRINLNDLKEFHKTWFKADHGTLVVVGDVTMQQILPKLKAHFSAWSGGEIPKKNIGEVEKRDKVQIYLVDKPGSEQSFLLAGIIATPKSNPDEVATIAMNSIIGGAFTSRINMNLREDKRWSYGSSSGLMNARGQRIFYVVAGVQTDKTSESIMEVMKELREFTGRNTTTFDELDKTIKSQSLSLAGKWESAAAVLGSLSSMIQYKLPDNYFDTYAAKVMQLTVGDIDRIASKIIHPDKMVWVVIGDRKKIEDKLNQLGYGSVTLIDADGNPIRQN